MPHHCMEQHASQVTRLALDPPQMCGKRAELRIRTGQDAHADPAPQIPGGIEGRYAAKGGNLLRAG